MTAFSANLGFLWTDLALPDAIRAAQRAGFDAVECHWPYAHPPSVVSEALMETGLRMLGINTVRDETGSGGAGLTALQGRQVQARAAIDQALEYAAAIGAGYIHAMAGNVDDGAAADVFVSNLAYAAERAEGLEVDVLIEPINRRDMPDYFLRDTRQAIDILDRVDHAHVRLLFDCYHVQITEGNVLQRLEDLLPRIGHIQIASVPDRAEPDHGDLDYTHVCAVLRDMGYSRPLGAEYKASGPVEQNLSWMTGLKKI